MLRIKSLIQANITHSLLNELSYNITQSMGNKFNNTLTSLTGSNSIDRTTATPVPANAQQNERDIIRLNELLQANVGSLGVRLRMNPSDVRRNGGRWGDRLVGGFVQVMLEQRANQTRIEEREEVCEQGQGCQNQEKVQIKNQKHGAEEEKDILAITLPLSQIYELLYLLPQPCTPTPSEEPLCVICFDKKPEQVLPCAHAYCRKCIEIYVVGQDHKCPMCRKSYREGLSGELYQIVEWDEDQAGEVRKVFFKILQKHNPSQAAKIAQLAEGAQGKVELRQQ